jgi:acetyl esterase/lipase
MRGAYVWALAWALGLAVSGCGGGEASQGPLRAVSHTVGTGADRAWVIEPSRGNPVSVVVFLHGLGDQAETTPAHHRPWLDHLARYGSYVIYPRYELRPGGPAGVEHAAVGMLTALDEVDPNRRLPLVLAGYSRGGGMAVELAALAPAVGLAPKAVFGVLPADMDASLDYRAISRDTQVRFLVGDMDTVVGDAGARHLTERLLAAGFPQANIRTHVVHSPLGFEATHLSALLDTNAARRAYWLPLDRVVAAARS